MRTHRLPHASSHEDTSWATTFGQPQVVAQPPQQPESHSLRAHRGSFTTSGAGKTCFPRALCSTRNLCSTTRTFWAGCPQVALPLMVHSFLFRVPNHHTSMTETCHITSSSCVSGPKWGMGEGRITTRIFLANARGHPARFARENTAAERSPAARQGNLARRCPARGKTPGSFASTPAKHSQRERVRERRDARSEIPGKPVKLVKLRTP